MLILNRFSGYNCSTCAYEQRGLKANLAEMQHIALLPLPQCRKSENAQQMAYDKNLDKAKNKNNSQFAISLCEAELRSNAQVKKYYHYIP